MAKRGDGTPQPHPGIRLRQELRGHDGQIYRIAWSPDGQQLASPSEDGTIRIWRLGHDEPERVLRSDRQAEVYHTVAWSPDSALLTSGSKSGQVRLWNPDSGRRPKTLRAHRDEVTRVAWAPSGGTLASSGEDGSICLWEGLPQGVTPRRRSIADLVEDLAWSPDGTLLAWCGYSSGIQVWDPRTDESFGFGPLVSPEFSSTATNLAWSPDGTMLGVGTHNHQLHILDVAARSVRTNLEGNRSAVSALAFSPDGRLLAARDFAGQVLLWPCDTWELLAKLDAPAMQQHLGGLAFAPSGDILAVVDDQDMSVVRLWELDFERLLSERPEGTVYQTSAKVVFVGESNVGKSCLALRLVEGRYEEQGTTHGMRVWQFPPEKLDPAAAAPAGSRREVVLWDMGGQEEYRLVHQLFVHDTAVAVMLFDPTRGRTAFDDVRLWNRNLERQLRGRTATKLLVGTKLDEDSNLVNRAAVDALVRECGFSAYLPTSAKQDRGVDALRRALAAAIRWDELATTSRPKLFQLIRDQVSEEAASGAVLLRYDELATKVQARHPEIFDPGAVDAVLKHLALQGFLADTRMTSGERVLVLDVREVERYAGSIIVSARNSFRGVPAVDVRSILAPRMVFPGIDRSERLPRDQEAVIVECVVQLLLEHGISLSHEGLLVFPALFQATEPSEPEATRGQTVSVSYDFSGAVDNVYSSLVASLGISERFGRMRLWDDRAEFERAGQGSCGIRRLDRGGEYARLDVYFDEQVPVDTRELFASFVDGHLRQHGVELRERLEVVCACGFRFPEQSVRNRIGKAERDIGCPDCDRRVPLIEGAGASSDRGLVGRAWALRTEIERRRETMVERSKQAVAEPRSDPGKRDSVVILHLSDLHMEADADPSAQLQPLLADLRDSHDGLGVDHLDYVVVSGDLTERAEPQEFEKVLQFLSGLIEEFKLTAERCVIVPGNHDLSWESDVYQWEPARRVDTAKLAPWTYRKEGSGYLIRDEERYPLRFETFSRGFFHLLLQQEYPLAYQDQCLVTLLPGDEVQFLALNSCWEIDEHFRERASVHPGAVARGLQAADRQVAQAREKGLLATDAEPLRIGVWHHPVSGNEKIVDDQFIEQLRKAGVRLCLHGHVHEERASLLYHLHRGGEVHTVGAGSFGAPAKGRPESTPRLYNLVRIQRGAARVRVDTRAMRREGGAWTGWAVWPGKTRDQRLTYYQVEL